VDIDIKVPRLVHNRSSASGGGGVRESTQDLGWRLEEDTGINEVQRHSVVNTSYMIYWQ
jgi:hypothetical protein